jgi:malonyl-CoA/methylmalonyl-CoA synthetase
VPTEPWSPHLAPGRRFDPASLTTGGTLPARWARRWPAAPGQAALHLVEGADASAPGRWCSYGELDERTRAGARHLAGLGLGPGDRLLWAPAPTLESVAVALATLRLGAVVVPVNPALTGPEISHVVADVRPRMAVVDDPGHRRAVATASRGTTEVVGHAAHGAGGHEDSVVLDAARPDDPALIVYTSGTTGAPKGAVLNHANLLAGTGTLAVAWAWEPADRLVLSLPLFHVHGLVAGLLGTLAAGASAVLVPRFSADAVVDAVDVHRATMFFGVPTMYHRVAAAGAGAVLGRLRLCVSGSAPLAPDLWWRMRREHGVALLERYGMTETLLTVSNPLAGERRPGTVGFPLPGCRIRLGAEGSETGGCELLVRGPTVFPGYWERPAATAESFTGGWFRTGDLVERDGDGYLSVRGRCKELIISGGFNVYPAEVEDVLLAHPAVAEVAVAGSPSGEWGESVTAWVVADGSPPGADELLAFAAERLAPYKRPRAVHFVDALPRNAMGKVQRGELGPRR